MKFCKNLQRVVDISDPEWAPYWTNYKMLKKLIKELPSLVPNTDDGKNVTRNEKIRLDSNQNHGDKTGENAKQQQSTKESTCTTQQQNYQEISASMGKSPGEVAFFKLLHSEFKKASHFFDRATEEFAIREERVREGVEIMRKPNSIMVNEKWALMAKSIYRLYKDLLLLETFAIMTYCSFSKILKKHDKVTGYETKNAFMANIVNKANFTHYPKVLTMITRCEKFYEEVSANLLKEGKEGLYEDERLFISMIHRLNEQVLDSADSAASPRERKQEEKQRRPPGNDVAATIPLQSDKLSSATSTLRTLVEENAENAKNATKPLPTTSPAGGLISKEANNGENGDDNDLDIDGGIERRSAKRAKVQ
mmetsp:Transcript_31032/g.73117  ORF Transcript_31032/g.73117 Transcript_31032/m.73117 type:complete len:365 (-) Transcript_31032:45-1139(-)|eukprot:CAMPEP_0172397804 /NCGR_PEP_ID=MMETSP1061-20121228/32946_1 /TAXON_ID=37318 /ORGANISM="Pseudo-nitzschia pungens, Strain cf. pungens" /LENGTH=364 /DNA_ID=CAMNT_0013130103 /DNA_START=59 /DNA_END=1156 /DNA_ORIENTATION=+